MAALAATRFERLPVEQAIAGMVKEFKKLRVRATKNKSAIKMSL